MDILITRRLTLRPPLEVDAEAITLNLRNPNVSKMLSRVPQPYGEHEALSWIERTRAQDRACYFTIHRQTLLGAISIEESDGAFNLGYWLGEDHWGNGYASEAARAVISYGFREFECDVIQSGAYADNPASYRVLEKLGFEPTKAVQDFNKTRNCDVTCNKVELKRQNFERLFGPLETHQAA